ncbi:MAG TPA: glycosyltransferase family 2 protein [Verrucomicrobiae bacterium]|nr:glycosyltransferase family 2 protein [Verrucomicrobiae bacterium]
MSLSVRLITKNEEGNIGRALRSVKGVADEVIVVDTGSSDRTIEIARGLGANVCQFTWIDDFSAARNFSFGQAHGDWIFWLDADEELLPESRDELLRCLKRTDALGYVVLRQDLQQEDKPELAAEMWQWRLFRRRADLRLVGRYHEYFEPPLEEVAKAEGKHVYQTTIRLRHYGYIGELKQPKLDRAAKFLKLELEERPGQIYYEIEYGRTLLLLGDETGHAVLREATKRILERWSEPVAPVPLAAALIEYLLVTPAKLSRCPLDRAQLHELAERWFPESAPLLWLRAQQHFGLQDFDAAAKALERLVRLGRKGTYDKWTGFDARIIGGDAVLNLAACYIRLGKLAEAEPLLRGLLGNPDLRVQASQNLAAIQELRRRFGRKK